MNRLPIQYSTYPSPSIFYVVKRITRVATVVCFLTVEPTDAALLAALLRELRLLKPRAVRADSVQRPISSWRRSYIPRTVSPRLD